MDDVWPYDNLEIVAIRGQESMVTYAIEVTEFNSEVRCYLPGCLEAAMASEVTKIDVRGNMHTDARVVEVTEFNSEFRCDL